MQVECFRNCGRLNLCDLFLAEHPAELATLQFFSTGVFMVQVCFIGVCYNFIMHMKWPSITDFMQL